MNVMNEIGKTLKLPKDKPQITILWGTDKEEKKTYVFENEEQKSFFMKGVEEANGWLEYEEEEK